MSGDSEKTSELEQYRVYERWSLQQAEAAGSERARKSYLNIAKGWADLAAQLEQSVRLYAGI
jgi:hypothetical protein